MLGTDGLRRRVGSKFKSSRSPPREAKKSNTQPLSRTLNLTRCTPRKAPSSSHQPVRHSIWRYPTKRLRCQSNPGGWSCVVSGRSYVIAGSFVVSGCCASVLIFVLGAGYDMHTYGAFSHKMRWRRNAPHYCYTSVKYPNI